MSIRFFRALALSLSISAVGFPSVAAATTKVVTSSSTSTSQPCPPSTTTTVHKSPTTTLTVKSTTTTVHKTPTTSTTEPSFGGKTPNSTNGQVKNTSTTLAHKVTTTSSGSTTVKVSTTTAPGCSAGTKGSVLLPILGGVVAVSGFIAIGATVSRRRRKKNHLDLFEPLPLPDVPARKSVTLVKPLSEFLGSHSFVPPRFSRTVSFIEGDSPARGSSGPRAIQPRSEGHRKTWTAETAPGFFGALWSEKIIGGGEDALPLLIASKKDGVVIGGVFDGLGGSGAAKINWVNGSTVSHAWESSRIARSAVQEFAGNLSRFQNLDDAALLVLKSEIASRLALRMNEIGAAQSVLTSSLTRSLPTTLAGFSISLASSPTVTAFWAGDSRTYLLDPQLGLRVLTRDDAGEADAFESLNNDPPLTNVICADRDFDIHSRTVGIDTPHLVITASDGCFNYWPTPANFEYEILNAIITATSWAQALDSLSQSIDGVTKDDVSLVIAAVGYSKFSELQLSIQERFHYLRELSYAPLVALRESGGTRSDFEAYRENAWLAYKEGYESLLKDES